MMARGHQVVGVTFGIGAMTLFPQMEVLPSQPFQTILFFGFVLFGSLLPDIDTPRSTLGQKFWRGLMALFSIAFFVYLVAPQYLDLYRNELKVVIMLMLPILLMVGSHRKITHSFLFIAVVIIYSLIIERYLGVSWTCLSGLVIGTISHLAADYVTKKGIPLIYPISKKHFQFPLTFRTGSLAEKMVVYSLVVWDVWFLTSQVF